MSLDGRCPNREEPPDRVYMQGIYPYGQEMSVLEGPLTGGAELNNVWKIAKRLKKIAPLLNNLQNTGLDCALIEHWSLFQLVTKKDRISQHLSWVAQTLSPHTVVSESRCVSFMP